MEAEENLKCWSEQLHPGGMISKRHLSASANASLGDTQLWTHAAAVSSFGGGCDWGVIATRVAR